MHLHITATLPRYNEGVSFTWLSHIPYETITRSSLNAVPIHLWKWVDLMRIECASERMRIRCEHAKRCASNPVLSASVNRPLKELMHLQQRGLHQDLALIEEELWDISTTVETIALGPDLDRYLFKQYEEQICGLKIDLTNVSHSILTIDNDNSSLMDKRSTIA